MNVQHLLHSSAVRDLVETLLAEKGNLENEVRMLRTEQKTMNHLKDTFPKLVHERDELQNLLNHIVSEKERKEKRLLEGNKQLHDDLCLEKEKKLRWRRIYEEQSQEMKLLDVIALDYENTKWQLEKSNSELLIHKEESIRLKFQLAVQKQVNLHSHLNEEEAYSEGEFNIEVHNPGRLESYLKGALESLPNPHSSCIEFEEKEESY